MNLTCLASRENQLAGFNCGFALLGVVIWYACGVSVAFMLCIDALLFFMICTLKMSLFPVDPSSRCCLWCSNFHNIFFLGQAFSFSIFLLLQLMLMYLHLILPGSICKCQFSGCTFLVFRTLTDKFRFVSQISN